MHTPGPWTYYDCTPEDTIAMKTLYVQGGIYCQNTVKEHFALVKPTGKNPLPYVWTKPYEASQHCRHHSHTYKVVDAEAGTLKLEKVSWECEDSVGHPKTVQLAEKERNQLLEAIANFERAMEEAEEISLEELEAAAEIYDKTVGESIKENTP